jgi:hypothetical protein
VVSQRARIRAYSFRLGRHIGELVVQNVMHPLHYGRNGMTTIDERKLDQLVGQILADLGGAASVAMDRMGDALGIYKTLHDKGSMNVRRTCVSSECAPTISA